MTKHFPGATGCRKAGCRCATEALAKPNIGDRYEYETVAEVIGYEPGSQRFKTVTDAWRRRVHEKAL
ncbi:MAG: hypothetical protein M9918_24580 [Anaerolineae bacterium]|nr:hypothetical protein [Anaerolineae bacterium]